MGIVNIGDKFNVIMHVIGYTPEDVCQTYQLESKCGYFGGWYDEDGLLEMAPYLERDMLRKRVESDQDRLAELEAELDS